MNWRALYDHHGTGGILALALAIIATMVVLIYSTYLFLRNRVRTTTNSSEGMANITTRQFPNGSMEYTLT